MKEAHQYYSIKTTYSGQGSGGLNRNRAVWANDKRMMQTPLGLKVTPGSKGGVPPTGGGQCAKCGGKDHGQKNCPNDVAKNDKNFNPRKATRACNKCGGSGHWGHHHKSEDGTGQLQTQQVPGKDCAFWLVNKCKRGDKCLQKHDQAKKGSLEVQK